MVKVSEKKIEQVNACAAAANITIDYENPFSAKGNTVFNVTCNQCGSKSTRTIVNLQSGKYRCGTCLVEKYKQLSTAVGFSYVQHDKTNFTLQCNECNSVRTSPRHSILIGEVPYCKGCALVKYSEYANNIGFDLIAKVQRKTLTCLQIACQKDATVLTRNVGDVKNGWVTCPTCQTNSYKESLALKGCTYLSQSPHSVGKKISLRISYKTKDGETFDADSSAVLDGRFTTTLDGHWKEVHSTYLIITEHKGGVFCKVGTSALPEKRMLRLKLLGKSKVYTLKTFPNRFAADRLESELHQEFKNFKLDRAVAEEFTTATKKVKRKGKTERVAIKDGSTEWFTHEVYDILKTRYNLTEGSANGS